MPKNQTMKKNFIILGVTSVLAVTSSAFIAKFSSGKTDSTGSPGESTCASCHSGGSGTTNVSVSFNPSVISGSYTPNQTYTITVSVINNPFSKFGFACEILDAASNSNIGTMSNPGSGVQLLTGGNGRMVATHNTPKTGTGSAQFTFEWTAPSSGNAVLYAIGNAVNGNGGTSGDKPSSTFTMSLVPDATGIAQHASSGLSGLIIYPNPVNNFMNIQFNAAFSLEKMNFSVMDLNGKTVFEHSIQNIKQGLNSAQISIPEYIQNGLYTLKISSAKESTSKLILIQK